MVYGTRLWHLKSKQTATGCFTYLEDNGWRPNYNIFAYCFKSIEHRRPHMQMLSKFERKKRNHIPLYTSGNSTFRALTFSSTVLSFCCSFSLWMLILSLFPLKQNILAEGFRSSIRLSIRSMTGQGDISESFIHSERHPTSGHCGFFWLSHLWISTIHSSKPTLLGLLPTVQKQ